ncbi:hypothetical protein SLEP1_g11138 [Rubroshorea leprosula]|uniref:Uncharacterized protein n=1 Tax=Rubroshorea leprosula TaxID=152421 RepID=A0AAV5IG48_9ROSI|nr:hypothetical protein SLEP1_g11138 [Rubroshorea leprosula]
MHLSATRIEQQMYCCSSFSQSVVRSVQEEPMSSEAEAESEFCSICLVLSQFKYRDEETLVKKESTSDMAVSIEPRMSSDRASL